MANIKDLGSISSKWVRRSAVAGPDYQSGIQNPRTPWAAAAAKGEDNYKAGVSAASARGAFGKGVKAAGDSKWQGNALRKGPGRYAEGVSLAEGDWQKGFAPYREAIASLTLPPRGMRGSPANLQRVSAIATTLRGVFEKKQGT